jgi:3D (Asp-Asp-Asp) domain-containing protein
VRFAFLALFFVACAGAAPAKVESSNNVRPTTDPATASEPAPLEELLPGFRITNYTLARETELSGQRSGNKSRVKARGLPGQYAWEFLCSGRGVAMQGTGVDLGGQFVHYVSGGGGFCGRDQHLCDCKNAKFAVTTGVFGSTGRELVEYFSIAVDPNVIPYGSFVWIDAMKRWFRADDTGGAILGQHIDVYVGVQPLVFNGETSVFVTQTPREATDPGPSGALTACPREGLVCGGQALPGEPRILYTCFAGRMTFARSCPSGCQRNRGNADDGCMPRPPTSYCSNDGWFCGGDRVDGTPAGLYRCVDHALQLESICDGGCAVDPDGISDRCFF